MWEVYMDLKLCLHQNKHDLSILCSVNFVKYPGAGQLTHLSPAAVWVAGRAQLSPFSSEFSRALPSDWYKGGTNE